MKFTTLALLLVLCAGLPGQVSMTVGPSPAPVGAAIAISVANDTAQPLFLPTLCPFRVRNEYGGAVFTPTCIHAPTTIPAGSVYTAMWDQVDDGGHQVPAGTYLFDVFFPGGFATTSLVIDPATKAGACQLGTVRIGTTRSLYLAAPGTNGMPYLMAASFPSTSAGIKTCAGIVPLAQDMLLELSLGPNPFFSNFAGILEGMPTSSSPSITVPNDPALRGVKFVVVFAVLDSASECGLRTISSPLLVLIT